MIWLGIAYLVVAALAIFLVLFWLLPSTVRWFLDPGEKPTGEDEMDAAVYGLRLAVSRAIYPPLERIVVWLSRHLPKAKP